MPLDLPADAPGLARAVRVSVVSDMGTPSGSHIRSHVGAPYLQFTDLTPSGP